MSSGRQIVWWPSKWVREESFWRDVTTRTLAAVIVLILVGFVNGYIKRHLTGFLIVSCNVVGIPTGVFWINRMKPLTQKKVMTGLKVFSAIFFVAAAGRLTYQFVHYLSHRGKGGH